MSNMEIINKLLIDFNDFYQWKKIHKANTFIYTIITNSLNGMYVTNYYISL